MTRGTTPTYKINLKASDSESIIGYDDIVELVITWEQQNPHLELNRRDGVIEDGVITVTLTQEETLAFKAGYVDFQVRGLYANGKAFASKIIRERVYDALYDEVIVDE